MFQRLNKLSEKQKYFLLAFLLFIVAFLIRIIKAGYWEPWGVDEMDAVKTVNTFEEATRWYKWHPMPPFHLSLNVVFKFLSSGSIFWQRFPTIFAGALSIPLFYAILKHFLPKSRWPFIFTLIPLTSFILIYYSQEIRSYAYFWLLILATLYYGYKVIVEGSQNKFDLLVLIFSFALLPLVHYLSIQHLLVLDFALVFSLFLFSNKKWPNLAKLFALNLLIPLSYIAWSDSAFYWVIKRAFLIGPHGEPAISKPFHFDSYMFWALIDKIVGGREIWALIIVSFSLISILLLIIRIVRAKIRHRIKIIDQWDRYVLFTVFYTLGLFLILLTTRYSEPLNVRHHLFIFWPLVIILSYGLIKFWETPGFKGLLGKILTLLILIFFIGNNILNTSFYFLSSHRFFPGHKLLTEIIEPMLLSGQKTMVYTEIGGWETFWPSLKNPEKINKEAFISHPPPWTSEPERSKDVQKLIDCCGKDVFFVFATNSKVRDRDMPKVDFKNLTFIKQMGQDKYLDYLNDVDASPYGKGSDFKDGYGTYMIAY